MMKTRPRPYRWLDWHRLGMAVFLGVIICSLAASRAADPKRRARPPEFDKSVRDVFFPDAREKLVGARPQSTTGQRPLASASSAPAPQGSPSSGAGWSQWITPEVVEDEIKSQQVSLAETVRNPLTFKGGDYEQAREELSVLALMFGIAAEYDGRIRWQREAASVRDVLAKAGFNCKVGTDASYKEAKSRSDDLQTLVRGGSVQLPAAGELDWSKVAGRPPLMKRIEQASKQTVAPLTASANEFERNTERLAHEAQLVAVMADVIARKGFEFADDETYLQHAGEMKQRALELRNAALENNYDRARQAAGGLGQTCVACHEGYRS